MPRLFELLRDAFDFDRTARVIVNFHNGALKHHAIRGDLEFLWLVGKKAFDDRLDFAANDTFMRPGETGIAEKSRAAGKDLFVGGLDVSVSSNDRADFAI